VDCQLPCLCFVQVPWLKRFHARHHIMGGDMRACDATRAHPLEEATLVTIAITSLNLLRCHFLSRFFFNIVIAYMLTEVHSGYDLPWMMHRVIPFGLVAGSVRHSRHHAKGDQYYQQFFTYLDDLYEWSSKRRRSLCVRMQSRHTRAHFQIDHQR
jgi:cholesterol 25-hydroxylase